MSENTASISVVIPAHNAEKYLRAAIESVLGQTLAAFEIIVVDDGSTDGTAHIAQSFADVKTIFQANAGAATARNNGAQNARGDFLAFLDADDLWMPQKLEWQIAALQNEDCDMVFGGAQQFISPELSDEERAKIHLPNENIPAIAPGAILLAREDFFRVGLLETSWDVGEFIDWYLKAGDAGLKTQVLPGVVLRRRIHTSNMGVLQKDARSDYVKILKAALDRRRATQNRQATQN